MTEVECHQTPRADCRVRTEHVPHQSVQRIIGGSNLVILRTQKEVSMTRAVFSGGMENTNPNSHSIFSNIARPILLIESTAMASWVSCIMQRSTPEPR